MLKKLFTISILLIALCFAFTSAQAAKTAVLLNVTGAISPATQDYIQRGIDHAETQHAALIILRLDTPGGLASSMRAIDQTILASSVPVVTYVSPSGARAASAGTFIMYASHVAAMAPGTNIGAASPVHIGFSQTSQKNLSTEDKKTINDAASYIRSLAELRGRNVIWAEQAVREGVSLSAEEALKQKVIDVIAPTLPALLQSINGRTINLQKTQQILQTNNLDVQEFQHDWRFQFLSIITDPSVAYILLLIGIYGLFFEFYNPGFVLPGVAGAIGLLLALYAFQLLPINYAGVALLLFGIVCMVAEVVMTSFGVLGIGGVVAFVIGSIFLLDTNAPGFAVAWQIIALMAAISALFFFVVINLAIRSSQRKVVTGHEALAGSIGEVIEYTNNQYQIRIHGEIWRASSAQPLRLGQKVRVLKVSGLLLTVEPLTD